MAFPFVASHNKLVGHAADVTDVNVPAPSTAGDIEPGDLILRITGMDGAPSVTPDGGQTVLFSGARAATTPTLVILAEVADGSEEGEVAGWTAGAAERGASGCFVIRDWSGTIGDIVVSSSAEGNDAAPNSPSVSGVSADNLFVSVMAKDGSGFITGVPTNYTHETGGFSAGSGSGAGYGVGFRQLAAASDDPDAFAQPAEEWIAVTLLIPPAAGADVTAPTLSSPTATSISQSSVVPRVTTDEANGTLYCLINLASSGAPDATAVKASSNTLAVTTTGTKDFAAETGLTPSTTYRLSFLHRDAAGNDSTISTVNFTTSAAADVTAPILTLPQATSITSSSVVPRVTTDEANGTLYALVNLSADAAPDAATIRLNGDADVISSTGQHTFAAATGLTESTGYRISYTHRDAAGNDSLVSSVTFTTEAAVDVTPPTSSGSAGGPVAETFGVTVQLQSNEAGGNVHGIAFNPAIAYPTGAELLAYIDSGTFWGGASANDIYDSATTAATNENTNYDLVMNGIPWAGARFSGAAEDAAGNVDATPVELTLSPPAGSSAVGKVYNSGVYQ